MKKLLFLFFLLLISVYAGLYLFKDPGYVLITYRTWSIETSVWIASILLILFFWLLYSLLRLNHFLHKIGQNIPNWANSYRLKNAWNKTNRGLIALNIGQWKLAESELITGIHNNTFPLLNYLGAAVSANEQGDLMKRDKYLKMALQSNEKDSLIIEVTKAKLQIEKKQYEEALVTLNHIRQIAPRYTQALLLLKDIFLKTKNWEKLIELIPILYRHKLINGDERKALETAVYLNWLSQKDLVGKANFEAKWNKIPRYLKINPNFISQYVKFLFSLGRYEEAEKLLYNSLKKEWNEEFVDLYGQLDGKDLSKALKTATYWLKQHPHSTNLYLTLARLSVKSQLWGKARAYYEEYLHSVPNAEAYSELGNLLERIGEKELASTYYKAGLELLKNNSKSLSPKKLNKQ